MRKRSIKRAVLNKVLPFFLALMICGWPAACICQTAFPRNDLSFEEPPASSVCTYVPHTSYAPTEPLTSSAPPVTEANLQISDFEQQNAFPYYERIPLQYEVQSLLWTACGETGCPYELALAVIYCESSFRNITGDNGDSIGYMQIQPRWNRERMERLGVTDLFDPLSNFRVGCDLLSELIAKYGSVEWALTCYNTGRPGSSAYANKVMAYMESLKGTET